MSLFRGKGYEPVVIKSGECLSEAFCMGDYSMIYVGMPADWTAASIGFYHSLLEAGPYTPLYDEDNAIVQISTATVNRTHTAPAKVAAGLWYKLWSQNGSGEDVNQDDERKLYIIFKS